ncbi:MAG: hypothetical protein AAB242_11890 [Nitrospirota bacterium]
MTPQPKPPLLLLGSGYTGRSLMAEASRQSRPAVATSRDPDRHLADMSPTQRLRFDLAQPDTWKNIPLGADIIWCFPATPLEHVQAYARTHRVHSGRLVVLGSTSAYEVGESQEYPPRWIDESAPIDLTKPRVQGEEYVRNELGAIVLRVAGIYGHGRNPLNWIRQRRVGPSRKYVNLIYVEDLAAICLAVLERGRPGEVYNVSDGQPHTWSEICVTAQQCWGVTSAAAKEDRSPGKRISNAKLRSELGYTMRHPDLYEALGLIESAGGEQTQDGQNGFQQGPRREGTGGVPSGVR